MTILVEALGVCLFLTLAWVLWLWSELVATRMSVDFWKDAADRVWELRRSDYNRTTALIDKIKNLEADLLLYIKAHNLVCEENVILIRSVKEAQQETALEKRRVAYKEDQYNRGSAARDAVLSLQADELKELVDDAADSRIRYADLFEATKEWRLAKMHAETSAAMEGVARSFEAGLWGCDETALGFDVSDSTPPKKRNRPSGRKHRGIAKKKGRK